MQIDIRWKLLREWLLAIPSSKQRPRQRQPKFCRLLRPCYRVFCRPSFIFSTLAPHPCLSFHFIVSFRVLPRRFVLIRDRLPFSHCVLICKLKCVFGFAKGTSRPACPPSFGFHPFLASWVLGYSWPQNGHKCFSYLFEWLLAIRPEASPNGLYDFRLEWS